jgi:copper(I)-binding protein
MRTIGMGLIGSFCALIVMLACSDVTEAHGYKKASIAVLHPWTRAAFVPGTRDCVVGMDLRNSAKVADRLLSATSKIAARVELRAADAPTAQSAISIPPAATVTLGRKGAHVVLIGVSKDLIPFDTLPVELVFEKAGRVQIDVLVEEATE